MAKRRSFKSLVIGGLIAVVGSAASLGAAFALYENIDEPVSMEIGAHTTKDVTIVATEGTWKKTNDTEGTGTTESPALAPGEEWGFTFNSYFTKESGSTYTQDYFLAKLSMTVKGSRSLLDKLSVESNIYVDSLKDSGYYSGFWAQDAHRKANFTVTGEDSDASMTASLYVVLPTQEKLNDGLQITAYFSLPKELTDSDFVALNGAVFSISGTLDEATDFDYKNAYIVGDFNNWTKSDPYLMVPNPKSDNFQWMYTPSENYPVSGKIKANSDIWSGGEDMEYTGSQTIYWSGNEKESIILS